MFTGDKTTAWSHEALCHFSPGDIIRSIVYMDDAVGLEADTYLVLDTVISEYIRGNPIVYDLLHLDSGEIFSRMYLTRYGYTKVA